MLRMHLADFDHIVRSGRKPSQRLLRHLIQAWGNAAWSADIDLLRGLLDWFPKTRGPILECGSGLSTLLLASLASMHGRQVHSLEHDPDWAERVSRALPSRASSSVEVTVAPIRHYDDFDWYTMEPLTTLSGVGFVVCDGPPGSTRGGRYGMAPMVHNCLAAGCVVLLDDTHRDAEREVLNRWCTDYGATIVQRGATFCALRIGKG